MLKRCRCLDWEKGTGSDIRWRVIVCVKVDGDSGVVGLSINCCTSFQTDCPASKN